MSIVLATGGLGFIGSHTCLRLIEEGNDVVVIDSLINSKKLIIKRIETILKTNNLNKKGTLFFRKGDIRNYEFVNSIFQEFNKLNKPISSVIHFAGLKLVDKSINNPLRYWDVNVNGAITLFTAMKNNNCTNIVFSSSATIYNSNSFKRLLETDNLKPINPYGNTKLAVETFLNDLFKSEEKIWRIANLRYFNPVGAHPSGILGEDPKIKTTNLFPRLLNVADKKSDYLKIFGNNWPTKDGTCVRDFIHVMDLADAHVLALKYLIMNKPQIINLNIGTGNGTSILEIISTFKNVLNLDIRYKFTKKRKGDYPYVVADNSKAKSILKWEPKKNIAAMCIDSWNWKKKNKTY